MEHLKLLDDIVLHSHGLPQVDQEERPEGIDVCCEDVSYASFLCHLIEVLPVEIVELVHEINTALNQVKHSAH